jgi:poly-gamma-glutamate synthesis protein (capsule biosynthesis protein)
VILLVRRGVLKSVVLAAIASLLTGLALAAHTSSVEGPVVVGVSEPVWHYLQPYYEGFREQYPRVAIELVVIGEPVNAHTDASRPVRWRIAFDDVGRSVQSDRPTAGASAVLGAASVRGVAVRSFDARVVPVVSAFNPTAEVSLEILRMTLAGELNDWSSVQPDWSGRIEFLTWPDNPADDMIMHLLNNADHYEATKKDLDDYGSFLDRLRLNPHGLALVPLARIAPGVNPVTIVAGDAAMGTQLVCQASVLELEQSSPFAVVRKWLARQTRERTALDLFIDYIRSVDSALSGDGAVTLVAVGDVMMDRGVRLAMNQHGMTHPFEGTHQVLSSADIAVANLETPISNRGTPLNMFRAYPDVMKTLRYSGIDVVSVANNHILDYDEIALSDTLAYLRDNGIQGVGAGLNVTEARRAAVLDVRGMTMSFLAYTELWFCQTKDNREYDATETRAGVAPLKEEVVAAGVASAAASSDFVVVSCHWGQEYNHYSNDTQRRLAHIATSAGARVVLGHHPHVLQGIEFGDSWVVAYSLGNFVFDQRQPGTQDSLILRITISAGHIVRVELLPCYIVDCRPVLLAGDLKRKALLELCRLSSGRAE